ncbi:hypothetical protein DENSPDRAFT_885716 [Dentipellis sp. KUC8613]|nr:hypothetical protein DENSPDRAFT_885716 [Dentipellis sp. KUC8613]
MPPTSKRDNKSSPRLPQCPCMRTPHALKPSRRPQQQQQEQQQQQQPRWHGGECLRAVSPTRPSRVALVRPRPALACRPSPPPSTPLHPALRPCAPPAALAMPSRAPCAPSSCAPTPL